MKKVMLLGGSRFLLPVIETAHNLGCYVITCDYLPDNFSHKYADEYCNVSIVDKEAVLEAARRLEIDGILSFACDPGVSTAAYVAEKMGLPSCGSYESVSILQNKGKFRKFLADNGFNVPIARSYTCVEDALKDIDIFQWPVIVKPTDSAGSKGVRKVDNPDKLLECIEYALAFSHGNEVIIEEFLEKAGHSSDTDCFSVNGELRFVSFSAQRFDQKAFNPYIPSAFSWPATITDEHQKELTEEIQRLLTLLNMKTSIYNIETRECTNGKSYIMEVSPRGGGNRLSEMLRYVTGVDLIECSIKAAIGESITDLEQKPYNGCWAEVILHSNKTGVFDSLWIADEIVSNVIEKDIWVKVGDSVGIFTGANETIGTLILKFKSQEELKEVLENIEKYVKVCVS